MSNFKKNQLNDIKYGKAKERDLKGVFEDYFTTTLEEWGEFSQFDFKNDLEKIAIELKSRRAKYKQYPSTMVGYNKILAGLDLIDKGFTVIFCFSFTDGIYHWVLQKDNFDKAWIKNFGRFGRGMAEKRVQYLYIPIDKLTQIYPSACSFLSVATVNLPGSFSSPSLSPS